MKTKPQAIAYTSVHIIFTFPDYFSDDLENTLKTYEANGIYFLDDEDDEMDGIISKVAANRRSGIKLCGSKWVYSDWIDVKKSTKNIPEAIKKVQEQLPYPTEVTDLEKIRREKEGSTQGRAVITEQLKADIIAALKDKTGTSMEIAIKFGVSQQTVMVIKRRNLKCP